ncbi:unnamed protein product, partial [Ectocarpus sp. 13 AM-2016]
MTSPVNVRLISSCFCFLLVFLATAFVVSLILNPFSHAPLNGQFRHYQFDTLRRAKHSSAMVLYHLHRPESRSLNPFCSRCRRPVRFVRYHCGVCNYDLCAECDEEVDTKCEDGHPLTPYRVTFSTEDAEESPAPGTTPATGGTSLSPRRSPVRERGGGGCARHVSPA